MNISNLKKFFSKSKTIKMQAKEISPQHDWKMAFTVFFIFASVLIAFNFYFLNKIKNDELFQVDENVANDGAQIDEKILESTLSSFDKKSNKHKELLGSPLNIKDPSLQ